MAAHVAGAAAGPLRTPGSLVHGVRLALLGAAAFAAVLCVWALAQGRRCSDAQQVRPAFLQSRACSGKPASTVMHCPLQRVRQRYACERLF